ncbi:MAG: hypothetical protein ACO1RX_02390 [Candidatus Sericytochromatia bacterium]
MSLRVGKIHCVPIFHNRLQFARALRQVFGELQPDVVAIELPDIYYSDLLQGIERLPRLTLLCLQQQNNQFSYLPIFPSDALIEGLRLAREYQLPAALIDLAVPNYSLQTTPFAAPDDEALPTLGLTLFYETVQPYLPPTDPDGPDARREAHMAARLQDLSQRYERILFVCGMTHWEAIRGHLTAGTGQLHAHALESVKAPFLAKLGPKARHVLLEEMPFLVLHYEIARRFGLPFGKDALLRRLLQEARTAPALAEAGYSPRELRNVLQYAYKLAVTDKRVSPDLFNLLLACKQALSDDFAIEVMDRALAYPYVDSEDMPEIEFDPEKEGFWMSGRRIELQRRLPMPVSAETSHDWQQLKIVRKKEEQLPQGYMPLWFFFGFFSHVPEDIVLEGFVDRLGDKLASEPMQSDVRLHPFQGSLMDGIDLRETIRLRARGQHEIIVREQRSQREAIGTWILIFDEELRADTYPWVMSLSAEHHNESDIAFYASNPALHPVTREIIRAEYGALMAFKPALPPEQKLEWSDLDIDEDLRKEHLIRLAIQHSPRPGILYFAAQAPEAYYFELARSQGKQLYHLPLDRVSARQLKRIRRFHLLGRRETRDVADDYI